MPLLAEGETCALVTGEMMLRVWVGEGLTRPPIPAPTMRMFSGCGSAVGAATPFAEAREAASWSMNIASLR